MVRGGGVKVRERYMVRGKRGGGVRMGVRGWVRGRGGEMEREMVR